MTDLSPPASVRHAERTAGTEPQAIDRDRYPYRMKDLCELTGLDRQTLHFYIQQGLLPEGKKTGRTMAYYGPEHVERVRHIRRLQHERFLPLRAIRALLEDQHEAFTGDQRALLLEVRRELRATVAGPSVPVEDLLEKHGMTRAELDSLVDLGLLGVVERDGCPSVLAADVWLLELWGELRRAGFTEERGFTAADLALYRDAIDTLFRQETRLLAARLGHLPATELAKLVERALPLLGTLLSRLHENKVRQFFAALG